MSPSFAFGLTRSGAGTPDPREDRYMRDARAETAS